jgi:hypothetical protein
MIAESMGAVHVCGVGGATSSTMVVPASSPASSVVGPASSPASSPSPVAAEPDEPEATEPDEPAAAEPDEPDATEPDPTEPDEPDATEPDPAPVVAVAPVELPVVEPELEFDPEPSLLDGVLEEQAGATLAAQRAVSAASASRAGCCVSVVDWVNAGRAIGGVSPIRRTILRLRASGRLRCNELRASATVASAIRRRTVVLNRRAGYESAPPACFGGAQFLGPGPRERRKNIAARTATTMRTMGFTSQTTPIAILRGRERAWKAHRATPKNLVSTSATTFAPEAISRQFPRNCSFRMIAENM